MNSKLIIFCVVTATCVSLSVAEYVDCSEQLSLEHIKTCCPVREFFTDEIKELCKGYYDAPSSDVIEESGSSPSPPPSTLCFMQCAFNATGIRGPDNRLDEDKMEEYLALVFDDVPEIIPIMEKSLRTCFAKDAIWKTELKELAAQAEKDPSTCRPSYVTVWSCVFTETFKHCPTSLWNDTKKCNKAKAFFTQCTPRNNWAQ